MDITHNIKSIRESKKVTQAEMARKLDLDPAAYFRIEKRGDKLSVEQLQKIALALGVSVIELLTGEPQAVQESERVKELEKNIKDLERGIDDFSVNIHLYLDNMLMGQAIDNRIGQLNLYVNGGERVELVDLKRVPREQDLNNWLETHYPNSYHADEVSLTDEEGKVLVRKILSKNKGLSDVLLIVRRLVKDEAWLDVLTERIERKNKANQ